MVRGKKGKKSDYIVLGKKCFSLLGRNNMWDFGNLYVIIGKNGDTASSL